MKRNVPDEIGIWEKGKCWPQNCVESLQIHNKSFLVENSPKGNISGNPELIKNDWGEINNVIISCAYQSVSGHSDSIADDLVFP